MNRNVKALLGVSLAIAAAFTLRALFETESTSLPGVLVGAQEPEQREGTRGNLPTQPPLVASARFSPAPTELAMIAAPVGSIRVQLKSEPRAALHGTRIRLEAEGRSPVIHELTGNSFETVFEEQPPGDYLVRVEGDSLPKGILLPFDQHRQMDYSHQEVGARVQVTAEEESELVLALIQGAMVYGVGLDREGMPLEWSHVMFGSMEPRETRVRADVIDLMPDGSYEIYLYPGLWLARLGIGTSGKLGQNLDAHSSFTHPLRDSVVPLPVVQRLAPGDVVRIDFQLGAGPSDLAVTFVDEQGQPFSDISAVLYPTQMIERETGVAFKGGYLGAVVSTPKVPEALFRAEGLMPGQYKLVVEPEGYNPLAKPGESTFGRVVQPISIDLVRGKNEIRLELPRARPTLVTGHVQVNPAWRAKRGVGQAGVVATLVLAKNGARKRDSRRPIQLNREHSYSFYLESREQDALLELSLGSETTLVPIALADQETGPQESPQIPIEFP
jgi:hypothetical protein